MSVSSPDREAASLIRSPLTRGALYAFLVFIALAGVWGSWHALYSGQPLMTVLYTLAAIVGLTGSWKLYHADRKLRGE